MLTYKAKCVSHGPDERLCGKKNTPTDENLSTALANRALNSKSAPLEHYDLQKSSGGHGFTLWNQAKMFFTAHAWFSELAYDLILAKSCPCGIPKVCQFSTMKIDVAQFFKAASVPRGTNRAKLLLKRLEKR